MASIPNDFGVCLADIAQVAARWCFADNSHFTRAFRKQYAETPSQFARIDATLGVNFAD